MAGRASCRSCPRRGPRPGRPGWYRSPGPRRGARSCGDPGQTDGGMPVAVVIVSVVAAAAVLGLTIRARGLARSARASDLARDEAMNLAAAARGERDARDAILSGLEDGVVLFDPDGSVVFQNQRAGWLLGGPADRAPRLAPKSLRELVDSARGHAEPREAEVAGPQGRSLRVTAASVGGDRVLLM